MLCTGFVLACTFTRHSTSIYAHAKLCLCMIVPLYDNSGNYVSLQLFSIFKLFTLFFRSHYIDTDIFDFEPPKRYHVACVLDALMHGSYS